MKRVSSLVDFCLEALFLTNAWVLIYINLVDYLNFRFPSTVKEIFFREQVANPEPFEIPLYLLFSFIFILLIWLWYRYISKLIRNFINVQNKKNLIFLVKVLLTLLLFVLFLQKISIYPLAHDPNPFPDRPDKTIYHFIVLLYIITLGVVASELTVMKRFLKNKNLETFLVYFFLSVLVAIITFEPRFPISAGEYAFFVGPTYEVAQGKTLYTNIPSQYSFIPILLFSILYKLHLFPLSFLQVLIWILWIIEYLMSFYLLHKITKSLMFSLIAIFSILTVNYLSFYQIAQSGPLRWLPIIFILFLFYKLKKIDSKLLIFSVTFLSFWFIDSGTYIVLGYFLTLFIFWLKKQLNLKQIIIAGIFFFLCYIGILVTVNIGHLAVGMQPVDFAKIFFSVRKHAQSGLVMQPIDLPTVFWLFVLVYFFSIIHFFSTEKQGVEPSMILFSANLMLFASLYFVGRSVLPNLFNLSIFLLLPTFFLLGLFYIRLSSKRFRLFFLSAIFLIFVLFPAFQREEFIAETLLSRYNKLLQGNIFRPEFEEILQSKYGKEANFIKNNLKENEVVIVSTDDTYLLYLTNKKNLIDANPAFGMDSKRELDAGLKRIVKLCPTHLAVDCTVYQKCPDYKTLSGGFYIMPWIIKEIENQCKVKYKPIDCTDKLCIVDSNIN
ncbi:hypothetical protein HY357_03650 [Candidatus Roizmanbacteria bacterium]|nr:hypothetical protein [Candidatus Roizmanbacteria bacterium]